jgi:hypothetical protein
MENVPNLEKVPRLRAMLFAVYVEATTFRNQSVYSTFFFCCPEVRCLDQTEVDMDGYVCTKVMI